MSQGLLKPFELPGLRQESWGEMGLSEMSGRMQRE